jgi:hypothetical protein
MVDDSGKYDIAISFLADDEPVAKALAGGLAERWQVFIYSDRQNLGGLVTDWTWGAD